MGQSKVLYAVGKAVCKPVFKLLYRYKTIIEEPLPLVGGMIIASTIYQIQIRFFSVCRRKSADCSFCLLYTSPSPRDRSLSRMPSSA